MEYTPEVKNRIKRIEGQVRGVLRLMEEGRNCKEVVSQLSAARNAIDRAIGVIVGQNLEACIRQELEKGEDASHTIQEAVDLLVRSR